MSTRDAAPVLRWDVGTIVFSVAMSHDGTRLASGSNDSLVRIWDVHTGTLILGPLKGHTSLVYSIAWSLDDTLVTSSSDDCSIRIWNTRTGTSVGEPLRGHVSSVFSVAFSPDGVRIVSGSDDSTVRIWDVRTKALIGEPLRGHTHWVQSVAFSPDNTRIVSGSEDDTIRMWDARTGASIGEPLQGHTKPVWSVAFSPDSNHIVSGSEDNTIRIWDAYTGAPVSEPLRGHTSWVRSVAFSPNNTLIVSGSLDKTIRVWDACTGTSIGEPLRGHSEAVHSVTFSPDSMHIISGSHDKTICIWESPPKPLFTGIVTGDMDTPMFDPFPDEITKPLPDLLTNGTQRLPLSASVTSKMSLQEMFACLVKHGCSDLSSSTDTNQSSAVITSGGFGDIRRLLMHDGSIVAIKTLRSQVLEKDADKAVRCTVREVYTWSRLRHINVQELLGIIIFQGGLGVVSPWMVNGNLKEYITAHPNIERYPLCIQLTSGVAYIHGMEMIHGDLKATNVLVSQDGTLKINDFGCAISSTGSLRFSTQSRQGGGTLRWMAPELFQLEDDEAEDTDEENEKAEGNRSQGQSCLENTRTTQTDIYALGMTMLEIFTGTVPYSEYRTDGGIYHALHTKAPPKCPKVLSSFDDGSLKMWQLLLKCWDHNPLARPDAFSILAILESLHI